jgi:hypothetical protein
MKKKNYNNLKLYKNWNVFKFTISKKKKEKKKESDLSNSHNKPVFAHGRLT